MTQKIQNIDKNQIVSLYLSGVMPINIAKQLKVSQSFIYRTLKQMDVPRDKFFNFTKDGKKKCRECQEEKSVEDFYDINGCASYKCIDCLKKYSVERSIRDKEKIKIRNKKWREKNKEYLKKKNKKWHEENREWVKEYNNISEVKERRLKTSREWRRNEIKNNPSFKIAVRLRNRMRVAIKNQSGTKKEKTIDLIGCSVKFLMNYLESKWSPGMNWGNYGMYGWHIDHIKPCCSFDLTNSEEQLKCFHYTNLQPLWWRDNLSKNGKY